MVNRMDDGGLTDGCLTQPSSGDEAEATAGEEMLHGCTRNPSRLACQRTGTARSSWRLRDGVVWKKVVFGGGLLVVVTDPPPRQKVVLVLKTLSNGSLPLLMTSQTTLCSLSSAPRRQMVVRRSISPVKKNETAVREKEEKQ